MLLYLFFEVQIKTPGDVHTTLALVFATQCAMIFKTRQFLMAASKGRAIQWQTREEPASIPHISPWVGILDGEAVLGALHPSQPQLQHYLWMQFMAGRAMHHQPALSSCSISDWQPLPAGGFPCHARFVS